MVWCILGFPFSPCPRYVKWPFETHCVFSIVSGVCCFWHIYTVYSIHRHDTDTTAHLSFFTRDSTWRPWEWVVVCSLSQCWYKLPFGTSPALSRGDSPMHYVWRLDWPGPLFCNTQARLGWRRKWAGIAVNADKANHGLFCVLWWIRGGGGEIYLLFKLGKMWSLEEDKVGPGLGFPGTWGPVTSNGHCSVGSLKRRLLNWNLWSQQMTWLSPSWR